MHVLPPFVSHPEISAAKVEGSFEGRGIESNALVYCSEFVSCDHAADDCNGGSNIRSSHQVSMSCANWPHA